MSATTAPPAAPPATAPTPQELHAARLLGELAAIDERVLSLGRSLEAHQLDWQPRGGGWSIGQVLEHLVVCNEGYLEPMRRAASNPAAPRASSATEWRPSLMGGLLVRFLDPRSTRKLPTPRVQRPAAQPRPRVAAEFMRTQRELADLMQEAAGIDWRKVRVRSPVSPLVRLNLGDCFTVLVVHARRHLAQIERVRSQDGFPAAGTGA